MSQRRVWHRLSELRRQRFVGRKHETSLFQSVLAQELLPFQVLYIFGAGGVGKTTLLREFAKICFEANTPTVYIDGRNIEHTPESFLSAIANAVGFPQGNLLDVIANHNSHYVFLIDTYEALSKLEDWLLQMFLPQLPENALIVLAGRVAPSQAWRSDPGWQALNHTIELRNLTEIESRSYLNIRQIPHFKQDSILKFTHGHPLALSLVADVFTQQGDIDLDAIAATDVVKTLLEQFVQEVPSPTHRTALEICAIVRLTTETLLAQTLGTEDAYELFNWLRGLSFMESSLQGIFPHDMARDAIAADLRWRNPQRYAELFSCARTYYVKRILHTTGEELEQALFDYLYKSQHARQFLVWEDSSNLVCDSLRENDKNTIVAMVAQHEGEASANLAAYWIEKQPQAVSIFRSSSGIPLGFMIMLALHEARVEDLQLDPATGAVWNYIQQQPLQPGEKATFCRFWMAADSYQAVSPIQTRILVKLFCHTITTANLAFLFTTLAEPDFWEYFCTAAQIPLLREAYFTVGTRHYGVCGRHYRGESATDSMIQLPEWVLAMNPDLKLSRQNTIPTESSVVINQSEFTSAVRQALRDYLRPDALYDNLLLDSSLVINRIGSNSSKSERVATLQLVLLEAIKSLQKSPREAKFYRALYHTYLHPAPSQEKAAEILDVSIASFHRHLKAGITRVTEILWCQEQELVGLEQKEM
ncbi:ATP-binding protein [Iningainema tapete]|uniref:ATP-binding protein n=1 Tax=Iningainema tapete BLCC-T55 TaxID=2748662 RepID=A0A8J6XL92_9CYAN|nr:ATP-binding protein [Iningainema tapete]MBD2774821.1 ATP-binding protein [Iningainema tapete BLCC-T55]